LNKLCSEISPPQRDVQWHGLHKSVNIR